MSGEAKSPPPASASRLASAAAAVSSLGGDTDAERRIKTIAPWFVSVAIHAGVIVLAVFITWTVTNLPQRDDESVLIVADFNAMNYEPVVGLDPSTTEQGAPAPLTRDLLQPLPQDTSVTEQLNAGADDPLRAVADLSNISEQLSGSAAMSSFTPPTAPNTATFGGVTGSNARKIAYVIDASGSMVLYLRFVIDELARSLSNLSPRQSFSVLFFRGNQVIEVPPGNGFITATDAERRRVIDWINANVIPTGGTNPVIGIQRALDLKPDVVFLLSQNITGYGQFEVDQKDLLELLNTLNPLNAETGRRGTQINCIQFLDEDPLGTMQLIAQQHGGAKGYRFMSRAELGLGPK